MKYGRAWKSEKTETKIDALVYPKSVESMVTESVERTLDSLIKENFLEEEKSEDPIEIKQDIKQKHDQVFNSSSVQPFWIALGVISLVFFVAINNLYYKISTLESWLHGRMLS